MDPYEGKRPWAKYRDVKDTLSGTKYRVPEGKLCLICLNVYKALGLGLLYSGSEYFKQLKKEEHNSFLSSVAEWIRQHNEDPQRAKLGDKKALMEAKTTFASSSSQGVRFKAPRKVFVRLEDWNKELDGELDPSKIVDVEIFGKKERGVYKTAGRQRLSAIVHSMRKQRAACLDFLLFFCGLRGS